MISTLFEHPIYKILPDSYGPALGIELRDSTHQTAWLALLMVDEDGSKARQLPSFQIPWWTNVLSSSHEQFITHVFNDPAVPSPDLLRIMDGHTGQERWSSPQYVWLETLGSVLRVKEKTEPFQELHLDLFSGEPVSPPVSLPEAQAPRIPVHYTEGNPYLAPVQRLIRIITQNSPVGACDYLELAHSIGISYYFYNQEKLENSLVLLTTEGDLLLEESLQSGTGLGYTTFIYWRGQLVYVKDQLYLCCYALH